MVQSYEVFSAMRTQWHVGMAGATGLRYDAFSRFCRICGVQMSARDRVFADLQIMERAVLSMWAEK